MNKLEAAIFLIKDAENMIKHNDHIYWEQYSNNLKTARRLLNEMNLHNDYIDKRHKINELIEEFKNIRGDKNE